jgi:hypothetical protein
MLRSLASDTERIVVLESKTPLAGRSRPCSSPAAQPPTPSGYPSA